MKINKKTFFVLDQINLFFSSFQIGTETLLIFNISIDFRLTRSNHFSLISILILSRFLGKNNLFFFNLLLILPTIVHPKIRSVKFRVSSSPFLLFFLDVNPHSNHQNCQPRIFCPIENHFNYKNNRYHRNLNEGFLSFFLFYFPAVRL